VASHNTWKWGREGEEKMEVEKKEEATVMEKEMEEERETEREYAEATCMTTTALHHPQERRDGE